MTHSQPTRPPDGRIRGLNTHRGEVFVRTLEEEAVEASGINPGHIKVAANAVDLVLGQLMHNETGIPKDPKNCSSTVIGWKAPRFGPAVTRSRNLRFKINFSYHLAVAIQLARVPSEATSDITRIDTNEIHENERTH